MSRPSLDLKSGSLVIVVRIKNNANLRSRRNVGSDKAVSGLRNGKRRSRLHSNIPGVAASRKRKEFHQQRTILDTVGLLAENVNGFFKTPFRLGIVNDKHVPIVRRKNIRGNVRNLIVKVEVFKFQCKVGITFVVDNPVAKVFAAFPV